jgi:hypothetical protein
MARRVFFSFHFQRDIFRVNQIRNHDVTKKNHDIVPFYDSSLWEESQKKGTETLRKLINTSLEKSTVTCVLIGAETAKRRWVLYEIAESLRRGNAIFGVYLHNMKNVDRQTDEQGLNPFSRLYAMQEGLFLKRHAFSYQRIHSNGKPPKETSLTFLNFLFRNTLSARIPVYDWVNDDGYNNFGNWVESAYNTQRKSNTKPKS